MAWVWNGRDGAERPLPVDAVAPGVAEGGDQAGQGDLCRVIVPPAVVAAEPATPRENVREGLHQCSAVRAVAAAVGAARLAVGVDVRKKGWAP